jgi:hypothetical protein
MPIITRIELPPTSADPRTRAALERLRNKINELVAAVNELTTRVDELAESAIDTTIDGGTWE